MNRPATKTVVSGFLSSAVGKGVIVTLAIAFAYGAIVLDQRMLHASKTQSLRPTKPQPIVPVKADGSTVLPPAPTALQMQSETIEFSTADFVQAAVNEDAVQQAEYEQTLAASPEDAATRFKLARLYAEQGNTEAAMRQFSATTDAPMLAADSWFELARLHARTDNAAEAVVCLREAEAAGFHDLVAVLADADLSALQSSQAFVELTNSMQHTTPGIDDAEPVSARAGSSVTFRIGGLSLLKTAIGAMTVSDCPGN